MAVHIPNARPNISTAGGAQKTILIMLTATGIVAVIENISGQTPNAQPVASIPRIVLGVFVGGALLLMVSYFLPEFAAGLAVVAFLTTVLERGNPFWVAVGNIVAPPTTGLSPSSTFVQNPQTPAALAANNQGGQSSAEPGGALNNPAARGPSLYGPLGS